MHYLFSLEILLFEEIADIECTDMLTERCELCRQVAAFEIENAVVELVSSFLPSLLYVTPYLSFQAPIKS